MLAILVLQAGVAAYAPACARSAAVPLAARRLGAAPTPLMLAEVDKASWCEKVEGADRLAVVFFYAPWCVNCKAVRPKLQRIEREFEGQAHFYQANFKKETALCYDERVFTFPTVHYYLPRVGRVARNVLTARNANERTRATLARFVGRASQADLLRRVSTQVLQPVVQYQELIGALEGLASLAEGAPGREAAEETSELAAGLSPKKESARLRTLVESDELRLAQLEHLFTTLDADAVTPRARSRVLYASAPQPHPPLTRADDARHSRGRARTPASPHPAPPPTAACRPLPHAALACCICRAAQDGTIELRDLESVASALRPSNSAEEGSSSALLQRLASASPEAVHIDRPTFVSMMLDKAVQDFAAGESALLPVFESLDTDADGKITQVRQRPPPSRSRRPAERVGGATKRARRRQHLTCTPRRMRTHRPAPLRAAPHRMCTHRPPHPYLSDGTGGAPHDDRPLLQRAARLRRLRHGPSTAPARSGLQRLRQRREVRRRSMPTTPPAPLLPSPPCHMARLRPSSPHAHAPPAQNPRGRARVARWSRPNRLRRTCPARPVPPDPTRTPRWIARATIGVLGATRRARRRLLDYERFVEMVSGRSTATADECEISDAPSDAAAVARVRYLAEEAEMMGERECFGEATTVDDEDDIACDAWFYGEDPTVAKKEVVVDHEKIAALKAAGEAMLARRKAMEERMRQVKQQKA